LEAPAASAQTATRTAIAVVAAVGRALIASAAPTALTRTANASHTAFTRKALALTAAQTRKSVAKYAELGRLEGHDREAAARTFLRVHVPLIRRFERVGRFPLQLTPLTEKVAKHTAVIARFLRRMMRMRPRTGPRLRVRMDGGRRQRRGHADFRGDSRLR